MNIRRLAVFWVFLLFISSYFYACTSFKNIQIDSPEGPRSCTVPLYKKKQVRVGKRSFAEKIAGSTVALVDFVEDDDDDSKSLRAYCTGVWVSTTRILTAAHCVDDLDDDETVIGDMVKYAVKSDIYNVEKPQKYRNGIVVRYKKSKDLALISASIEDLPIHNTAFVTRQDIRPGDRVYGIGHTAGLLYTYMSGDVSAIRTTYTNPHDFKIKLIQVSIPNYFGNSGGGLFNEKGELLGICSFLNTRTSNLIFYIHADEVNDFIK